MTFADAERRVLERRLERQKQHNQELQRENNVWKTSSQAWESAYRQLKKAVEELGFKVKGG